jgi:hypothetical protein
MLELSPIPRFWRLWGGPIGLDNNIVIVHMRKGLSLGYISRWRKRTNF